jgi:hypothetical protein
MRSAVRQPREEAAIMTTHKHMLKTSASCDAKRSQGAAGIPKIWRAQFGGRTHFKQSRRTICLKLLPRQRLLKARQRAGGHMRPARSEGHVTPRCVSKSEQSRSLNWKYTKWARTGEAAYAQMIGEKKNGKCATPRCWR